MEDDDIRIESAAGELTSGIPRASAIMMKAAYLPAPQKKKDDRFDVPFFRTPPAHHDEEVPGPNARVYITKISGSTPVDEIRRIPGTAADIRTHDFYTLLFYLNIQLDEPSTTRFINAVVTIAFPPEINILNFSPGNKEIIAHSAETAGDEIIVSPSLVFSASMPLFEEADDRGQRYGIRVGPDERIIVTWRREHGYVLTIPKYELLEYEGMGKNEHEVFWEVYPRMPPHDREMSGRGMHAIFPVIVQAPRKTRFGVAVRIEGKVKGDIWGVVPIKGSVVFQP